jgi:hypothetical protein
LHTLIQEHPEDCSLTGLGFTGDPFTWRNNGHKKDQYIRERLDWVVVDEAWWMKFPNFKVINGRHSDHRPMIVVMENPPVEPRGAPDDFF